MFAKRILVTAGALALAAGLAGGLARSAQASSFPVIPQANLSYTCDAPRPIFILFSDVKAGNCSVEFAGNSLLYYTSGVVGARGPGSYIRWYKWSRTAEWGTGEGYNIADQNLRVTVEACVVRSYHGQKYFSKLNVFWPKGAPAYGTISHYRWTGSYWAWANR